MQLAAARHHALRGQWEEGRRAFAAAEALNVEPICRFYVLTRRALFELRAGQDREAAKFETLAKAELAEPTTAMMLLAIEASRYGLSHKVVDRFKTEWNAALKKKCSSQTAGEMCRALTSYLVSKVAVPSRIDFLDAVVRYVQRSSRVKFCVDDFRHVCEFLEVSGEDDGLLTKYSKKGRKQFGQVAFFHYLSGEREMAKGPSRCNRRLAHGCFERAVECAAQSRDPADADILAMSKKQLNFLKTMGWYASKRPGFFGAEFVPPQPKSRFQPAPADFDPIELLNEIMDDETSGLYSTIDQLARTSKTSPEDVKQRLRNRLGEKMK